MKLLAVSLLLISSQAFASVFNFAGGGNLGNTHTFTSTPATQPLVLTGFSIDTIETPLYGKNGGGDENGIGLAVGMDHEIFSTGFIQVDISALVSKNLSFIMGSSTGGETWDVFGSNVFGVHGANLVASGSDESTHNITATTNYLDFVASSGDVLLASISQADATTNCTPEPGTLFIAAGGLLLVGFVRYRKV